MTENELKRSLIARINQIKDPAFLKALLVITEGQMSVPAKQYNWREPAGRHWIERHQSEGWENSGSENFFEDMEQLLRENN